MTRFLSCVGFDFPKTDRRWFFDEYIKMLEYYEAEASEKVTVCGQEYLVLKAEPLEMLFSVDGYGDSNADEVELFYPTGFWQPIVTAEWLPQRQDDYIRVANVFSAGGISLNVCVPGAYAIDFNRDYEYEMQTACFATMCSVCSEEVFLSTKTNMAPMSFINKGSFQQDASCIANGRIMKIQVCLNPYSRCEYYHFTAQCEDIVLDILADKGIVTNNVHIGDIISVEGWLVGKFRSQ